MMTIAKLFTHMPKCRGGKRTIYKNLFYIYNGNIIPFYWLINVLNNIYYTKTFQR